MEFWQKKIWNSWMDYIGKWSSFEGKNNLKKNIYNNIEVRVAQLDSAWDF